MGKGTTHLHRTTGRRSPEMGTVETVVDEDRDAGAVVRATGLLKQCLFSLSI
jgi:hypothetical protein